MQLFNRFDQGVVIAIKLVGEEKVFWAVGQAHNPKINKATKHLVDGDMRREQNRTIIEQEKQLQQFMPQQLYQNQGLLQVQFSIPLPDDLPASFIYCGEMMSRFSVEYKLTAMMFGLKGAPGGTPETSLIIQQHQNLYIREFDPPMNQQEPIKVEQVGKITGTLGIFGKGESKATGTLQCPRVSQNAEAMIKIAVDNSKSEKMV